MVRYIKKYTSLVVFAHTVFALPFALIACAMAYISAPPERPLLLLLQVLGCMVTARNSAMSFNRYVDRHLDAQNERTKGRELPSGTLSPTSVLVFFTVNVFLFLLCSWSISSRCLYLASPALVILCGYSFTKRFTWLCHFVLGLALSMAPAGAFIAVTGTITLPICWLSLMVALWVSGFDMIYALTDENHDRLYHVHAVPAKFGQKKALWISGGVHLMVLPAMCGFGITAQLHVGYWMAVLIFTCLLIYQHAIVKVNNISRVNMAFFTVNGWASILFAALTIWDLLQVPNASFFW